MMGRLHLTATEAAAVVLDDGAGDFKVHPKWALVGKVLSPSILHINTITSALRPAWGNPRGLVINPGGDNVFVAEFATKADKDRVVDGPPWVVGKHGVLLREFDVDQRPKDMVFKCLKVWIRIINLPFGYMHRRWGEAIVGPIGMVGSVPLVDCDATGRCWGSYMRVRVEIDVHKPLMRGVTVFSQRLNVTEWFDVQYENLPHYCFSCGILGHGSTECKDPGEREADGRHPYSADRLCTPDDRKKKYSGAKMSSGSASAGQGRSSTPVKEKPSQSHNNGGAPGKPQHTDDYAEVSSPAKDKQRARTKKSKADKSSAKEKLSSQDQGIVGQKRKSQ
uniref:Uncharacterized protein n=1 Tax=Avena sativa TaxID=4498 RepID=A0ACD5YCK1_AVESA